MSAIVRLAMRFAQVSTRFAQLSTRFAQLSTRFAQTIPGAGAAPSDIIVK
jgi:hypothetical protein